MYIHSDLCQGPLLMVFTTLSVMIEAIHCIEAPKIHYFTLTLKVTFEEVILNPKLGKICI